jgi:hypothetical protein
MEAAQRGQRRRHCGSLCTGIGADKDAYGQEVGLINDRRPCLVAWVALAVRSSSASLENSVCRTTSSIMAGAPRREDGDLVGVVEVPAPIDPLRVRVVRRARLATLTTRDPQLAAASGGRRADDSSDRWWRGRC